MTRVWRFNQTSSTYPSAMILREEKLQAENPDNNAIVLAKFEAFSQKRDPQLMLREKFWLHLRQEPAQLFDSWVVTVKERAAKCKSPVDFYKQAVTDKLTFSCKEDSYKLKLYDQGAALSLENTVKILSMKEATKRELQESKTAEIESVTQRDSKPDPQTMNNPQRGPKANSRRRSFHPSSRNCAYCNRQQPPGRRNCPAAKTRCNKCNKLGHFPITCRNAPVHMVNQVLDNEGDSSPTFVGRVTTTPTSNKVCQTSPAEPIAPPTSDSGWHIKLKINELTWCVNTGAQESVMLESG